VFSGKVVDEGSIGEDLEESGHGSLEILTRNFPGETESQNRRQDSRCPGRDSNLSSLEYECRALRLVQRARFLKCLHIVTQ
jgi:hypothetical protein